jgi:hypothetical protein
MLPICRTPQEAVEAIRSAPIAIRGPDHATAEPGPSPATSNLAQR